jgi:hypothetical protein
MFVCMWAYNTGLTLVARAHQLVMEGYNWCHDKNVRVWRRSPFLNRSCCWCIFLLLFHSPPFPLFFTLSLSQLVFLCTFLCVCVYVCVRECVCVCVHVCVGLYKCECMCVYVYACLHVCAPVCCHCSRLDHRW